MFRPYFSLALASFVLIFVTGCATTSQAYHEGETEEGMASWYGQNQGRATASGERFNARELTAAHRHIPFGSIVRVTNRNNGLSVDVVINDRGPWGDGDRIIDVSSAAADVLQMKHAGLVPVEIEVIQLGHERYHHKG